MAQRIGIIAGILLWGAASAAHTPLEFHAAPAAAAWQFEGNRTACRLTHEIPNFGEASFVQEAGGTLSFDLSAWRIDLNDEMDVTADAPAWLSEYPRTEALGKVIPRPPHEVLIGTDLAEAMLTALYRGEHPRLASKDVSVSLSAVSFRPVYDAYARCAAQLLPASFSQLERSTIRFAAGNAMLDDRAKARLDLIADYVHADQSVAHIRVTGHSDSTGRERGNQTAVRAESQGGSGLSDRCGV